ncbi:ATP-binding protein [Pseudalkalibacillus caeni]|uniref:histidine kinase n=1 Tax=Exobacillus caeni TaxID=2574798 RepID=A0A5R9F3A2_9BACL|nr:ATP-binding protein [Pseudalkalibacillus caeni]TLS38077.1 two-component sensor histidine kinase [Pseudalkalibacillus caeni]
MLAMLNPLIVNIAIIFSMVFIWNMISPINNKALLIKHKLFYGLVSSIAALLCMYNPLDTFGETVFDLRTIPLLLVTLYGGGLAGFICTVSVAAARLFIGGEYAWVGVIITFAAFLTSFGFSFTFKRTTNKWGLITYIGLIFGLLYIMIINVYVRNLPMYFYPIYYFSFYITYFLVFFLFERLIRINLQLEETVYLEKLSVVGKMAAAIAHEIRNPLTTVRGLIQHMEADTEDKKLKQFSPLLLEELDRTNKIITDYLKLVKPSEMTYEKVDLNRVVNDTVELIKPIGSYHNVKIELREEDTFTVEADEQQLKQCIINLVNNGIEAIEQGKEEGVQQQEGLVSIIVDRGNEKSFAAISIVDNGRGMTEEEIEKIGLPFYTTKTKGTGLGTMITNRLVRNMGGKVQYESEFGRGTIARILLPAVKKQ